MLQISPQAWFWQQALIASIRMSLATSSNSRDCHVGQWGVDTESMIKELSTCHIRLTPASSNLFSMGHHDVSTGLLVVNQVRLMIRYDGG
ncbi:hypothetical protein NOF04DRAFT_1316230 [Fusarium oxysporum II5]|nr:hypothetical protein NOF04DRAFT_1316230 [Fusarium oxysporum II5]